MPPRISEKANVRSPEIFVALACSVLLCGCQNLNEEANLRSWQQLRKESSVLESNGNQKKALSASLDALKVSEAFGANSVEKAISLNETSEVLLRTKGDLPPHKYADECIKQCTYWSGVDTSNPARFIALTELAEAFTAFAGLYRAIKNPNAAKSLDEQALVVCEKLSFDVKPGATDAILGKIWGGAVESLGRDYLAASRSSDGRNAVHSLMEKRIASWVLQSNSKRISSVYAELCQSSKSKNSNKQLLRELNLEGSGEENSPTSQWSRYMKIGKDFLRNRNDPASAETMFVKALAQAKLMSSPGKPCGQALYQLGSVYVLQSKYDLAESALNQSVIYLRKESDGGEDLDASLDRLTKLFQKLRKLDKAEKVCVERLALVSNLYGPDSVESGLALMQYSGILCRKQSFALAEKKGRESVAIIERKTDSDDARLALAKTMLVAVYIDDKKFEQARPVLADALKIWQTQRAQNPEAAQYAEQLYAVLKNQEAGDGKKH